MDKQELKILEAKKNIPMDNYALEKQEQSSFAEQKSVNRGYPKLLLKIFVGVAVVIILEVALISNLFKRDISKLSDNELKDICQEITYDNLTQNIDHYAKNQMPIKLDCIVMLDEEDGFFAIDTSEIENPEMERSYFILTEEDIQELSGIHVYGYTSGINGFGMPLIVALYMEPYTYQSSNNLMNGIKKSTELPLEENILVESDSVSENDTLSSEIPEMASDGIDDKNFDIIPVDHIFHIDQEEASAWYSNAAKYYMFSCVEESGPVVIFMSEDDMISNNPTSYYTEITSIDWNDHGGLVCSGPMYVVKGEYVNDNGTVEITWNSWETIDYPSIRMINENQMTDVSMIADDYSYWGLVEKWEDEQSEYVFPDSSDRLLTEADTGGLAQDRLRIAINEIYARHGRIFDSEDLQLYFNSCSWYNGTVPPNQFDESVLNEIEIKNISFLREQQEKRPAEFGPSGFRERGLSIEDPFAVVQQPGTYRYDDGNGNSAQLIVGGGYFVTFWPDNISHGMSWYLDVINDQEYWSNSNSPESDSISIIFDDYGRIMTLINNTTGEKYAMSFISRE